VDKKKVLCPFCNGKKIMTSVDGIEPGGKLLNPRQAPCILCSGAGEVDPEDLESDSEPLHPRVDIGGIIARATWGDPADVMEWAERHAWRDVPNLIRVVKAYQGCLQGLLKAYGEPIQGATPGVLSVEDDGDRYLLRVPEEKAVVATVQHSQEGEADALTLARAHALLRTFEKIRALLP
jgi:hypothetical protein